MSGERLAANLRVVQGAAGGDAEVIAVVKANGYGHGAALCAPVLRDAGARWLGVTDAAEGVAVRGALGEAATDILVMCGMEVGDAAEVVAHGLTPVVWRAETVAALEAAGRAAGLRVGVVVEVDTGMSRQGCAPGSEFAALLALLGGCEAVVLTGVMTHLCCAEVVGAAATARAEGLFAACLRAVQAAGLRPELVHIANTSAVDSGVGVMRDGALAAQAAAMGARLAVRTGLALYGYALPLEGDAERVPLLQDAVRPVLSWKARVLDVRDVAAGASVGYGATFVAAEAMRLALLPVGYADGFRREASSGVGDGWVVIGGRRAPVVGRVSMNLTVVDVSAMPDVEAGTEVVLLGEGVSADDHARWAGTIAYDVLCGVRGALQLR